MALSLKSYVGSEFSTHDEEEEEPVFNLGLYIGGRNALGQRHGRGWAILPNGDQYDGQYRRGKRHGFGLYVWKEGHRYYGQYRCGHRSGRGMFIYPDGTVYEGGWHKNMRHGKGRYNYANGDTYTGDWYGGKRHGVGIYSFKPSNENCSEIRFKGTWVQGQRQGPFQLFFGGEENCTILHGNWEMQYPMGPAVFTFDQRYMLQGYFNEPSAWERKVYMLEEEQEVEEDGEETKQVAPFWYAQDISCYDFALLPQEPLPLPISDSDLSICSASTLPQAPSMDQLYMAAGEGEEECDEDIEYVSEICTETQSHSSCSRRVLDPCTIEIVSTDKCDETMNN